MLQMTDQEIEEIQRLKGVYVWMQTRCYKPEDKSYARYGGRGIFIAEPWNSSVSEFVRWSLGNGSAKGKQLDRIDGSGPYSPENCRWVSPSENQNNRENTIHLTAFGETKPFTEWLNDPRCLYGYALIANRLKLGWDHERAMTEPLTDRTTRLLTAAGETKTWREWLSDPRVTVKEYTLKARMGRGWTDEECLGFAFRPARSAPNEVTIAAWGETKTITQWLKDDRVTLKDRKRIWQRINSYGWRPEDAFDAALGRKPS